MLSFRKPSTSPTLADRIAVTQGGVIQQLDTPQMIYRKPANRFVASFVGSPAMNFIPGRIVSADDGLVFAQDGLRVALSGYANEQPLRAGPATLGVRPEHVVAGATAGVSAAQAQVEMVGPMGADSLAWRRMSSGTPLSIRFGADAASKAGDSIPLSFPAASLSLFDDATGKRF